MNDDFIQALEFIKENINNPTKLLSQGPNVTWVKLTEEEVKYVEIFLRTLGVTENDYGDLAIHKVNLLLLTAPSLWTSNKNLQARDDKQS